MILVRKHPILCKALLIVLFFFFFYVMSRKMGLVFSA